VNKSQWELTSVGGAERRTETEVRRAEAETEGRKGECANWRWIRSIHARSRVRFLWQMHCSDRAPRPDCLPPPSPLCSPHRRRSDGEHHLEWGTVPNNPHLPQLRRAWTSYIFLDVYAPPAASKSVDLLPRASACVSPWIRSSLWYWNLTLSVLVL
jgi:hypothetical protein